MVSENTIFFYSGRGGHSHDGENSSFIDTSKYSLFDFSWGLLGDPDRQASQDRNYNSFKDFIINTVNQSILNPAGLVLQPGIVNGTAHIISRSLTTELIAANAITANEILAGTITADELSANIILVNNVIRSNNFNGNIAANGSILTAGTTGWAIAGDGTAVFDSSYIRGTITAGAVSTPGVDILANGAIVSNNFVVSANGIVQAAGAIIGGTITATSGSIAGWDIVGDDLRSGSGYPGDMIIGPNAEDLYGSFTGAIRIDTPVIPGVTSLIARYSGYGTNLSYANTVSNTVLSRLDMQSDGIVYQHGNQRFEFYYDSALDKLYAVIDGTYWCIQECAAGPVPEPEVTPEVTPVVSVSPAVGCETCNYTVTGQSLIACCVAQFPFCQDPPGTVQGYFMRTTYSTTCDPSGCSPCSCPQSSDGACESAGISCC
jgi:hypothetical protein